MAPQAENLKKKAYSETLFFTTEHLKPPCYFVVCSCCCSISVRCYHREEYLAGTRANHPRRCSTYTTVFGRRDLPPVVVFQLLSRGKRRKHSYPPHESGVLRQATERSGGAFPRVSLHWRRGVAARLNKKSILQDYRKYRSLDTPRRLTFQARLLHNQEGPNVEKGGFRKISSRAFFRHIGRCSHPLGCEAIEPGKST